MTIAEWIDRLSVHGVRFIFNRNGTKFSRSFWMVAMLVSLAGLGYNFHLLYLKLTQTPDINVRVKQKFTHDIPFPAITVCNPLFARDSLVRYYNISKHWRADTGVNVVTALNLSDVEQQYLESNIQACDTNAAILHKRQVTKHDRNVVKLLNESSLQLSEAIINCHYRDVKINCSTCFNRVLTDRGYCFSFNMLGFNTIFNERTISKDFHCYKRTSVAKSLYKFDKEFSETVDDARESFKWSLDNGFDDNHSADAVPIKVIKRKYIGFNAYLKETDTQHVCTNYGNLFSVFMHLPNEMMLPAHQELYIEFRKRKEIKLTATVYTADESMRKFTPRSRGCYFEGEKQLKFFNTYTKALCEFECLTNYTLKTCNCVKFSMPRGPFTPVCSIEKVDCYFNAMNTWPDHTKNKDRFDITCGCLKTCNDIKYDVKFEKISSSENVMFIFDVYNLSRG